MCYRMDRIADQLERRKKCHESHRCHIQAVVRHWTVWNRFIPSAGSRLDVAWLSVFETVRQSPFNSAASKVRRPLIRFTPPCAPTLTACRCIPFQSAIRTRARHRAAGWSGHLTCLSPMSLSSSALCLTDKRQTIGGGARRTPVASGDQKRRETLGQRSPAAPGCLLPASF